MRFKAKIDVAVIFRYNQPYNADGVLDEVWEFSKTRLHFTKEQLGKYGDDLTLDPNIVKWVNGARYSLDVNDLEPKYRVVIKEFFAVTLRLNWWNKFKMKWIHKKYWLQSEKSNWFKTPLVQQLLAGLIAIGMFFLGKAYGYDQGYKKGFIDGKASVHIVAPPPKPVKVNP